MLLSLTDMEALAMLNKSNQAEWMAGWAELAQHVTSGLYDAAYCHKLARYYAGESAEWAAKHTAHHSGYLAALSAAIGVL